MVSVIVLSLLIVATFVVLCYMFSEARIELDSPTIAAMEARAEAEEASRKSVPWRIRIQGDAERGRRELCDPSVDGEFLLKQQSLPYLGRIRQRNDDCETE